MLAIRDDAFAELGDDDLDDAGRGGRCARVRRDLGRELHERPGRGARAAGAGHVRGAVLPGSRTATRAARSTSGRTACRSRNGTYTANFNCGIPRKAVDVPAAPGAAAGLRPRAARHRLPGDLGRPADPRADAQLRDLRDRHDRLLDRRRPEHRRERPAPARELPAADRPRPAGPPQHALPGPADDPRRRASSSDAAFHVDGTDVSSPPVIDTSRLYYNGNSQGGILGGAATAVAPDWTRATLGVPAMNYSVLLNRSVDFDLYKTILDPAYPSPLDPAAGPVDDPDALGPKRAERIRAPDDRRPAAGHAGARGPAERRVRRPPGDDLAGGRRGADDRRRRARAGRLRRALAGHRRAAGACPRSRPTPTRGRRSSTGTPVPPVPTPGIPAPSSAPTRRRWRTCPNRTGEDPHGDPRVAPEEMQMVSDFLRPDAQSQITDTCLGLPCFAGGFTGPP